MLSESVMRRGTHRLPAALSLAWPPQLLAALVTSPVSI